MKKYQKIGKIKDAFGIKGDLYIIVFSGDISWIKKLKVFSLKEGSLESEDPDLLVVKMVRPHKDGIVVHCEGIDTRNQSELLKGKNFCIDSSLLKSQKGESIFLAEIQGFSVFEVEQSLSASKKCIGSIESFSSNGIQDLLVVRRGDGKISEIPFVKDFVQEINFDKKEIYLTLPSGLLEIND
ncbi:MAG TPA: ribosome maturation factor RimM [Pseudobdellovibrionaceae bacterium]|nr:ribosome maturation factor RimM [Pseudobdellovibrionaceae bacterium]